MAPTSVRFDRYLMASPASNQPNAPCQGAVATPLQQVFGVNLAKGIAFGIGLQLIEAVIGVGLGFYFLSREGLSIADARGLRNSDE